MDATVENATRRCPVCGSGYPANKNFCRLDGAGLVDVPAEPAVAAAASTPSEVLHPIPDPILTVRESPAASPVPPPEKPSVVNHGGKSALLTQVLVGAGVGVLLLALLGGGFYLVKQRQAEVPPVPVAVVKSPTQVEGEINRALRDAGLNDVFSAVDDQYGVLLKGTVSSETLKEKAIETARAFPQVTGIKDMVFVVEQ